MCVDRQVEVKNTGKLYCSFISVSHYALYSCFTELLRPSKQKFKRNDLFCRLQYLHYNERQHFFIANKISAYNGYVDIRFCQDRSKVHVLRGQNYKKRYQTGIPRVTSTLSVGNLTHESRENGRRTIRRERLHKEKSTTLKPSCVTIVNTVCK
jgi:hypothetical protein